MKQYQDTLEYILKNGSHKKDRTGTGVISSIDAPQMVFDLSLGFPAVTTKKLAWKSMLSELLWFIEGSGDERRLAEILYGTRDSSKKTIWTDNANAPYWKGKAKFEGDLGRVYGVNWRDWQTTQYIKPQIFEQELFETPFSKKIILDYSNNKHGLIGQKFSSNHHGDFIVIKEYHSEKHLKFDCQFITTGFIRKGVNKVNIIKTKEIRDLYYPTRYGVGAIGNIKDLDSKLVKLLAFTWDGMLSRCYNKNNKEYFRYGAKGFHVSKEWLIFENFVKDFKKIPRWELKLEFPSLYTLDKDLLGSNRYSVSTVMWASKKEQTHNSGSPQFYNDPESENLLLIRRKFIDQLQKLIAGIKHDPNGRRHILTAWNVGEVDNEMALPPCHTFAQFFVVDNKLSCKMYQRSADFFLGVPFNIASYALFTHMIAQVCDLEVGKFIHLFGDAHIYLNHIDAVHEQLSRTPHALPTLKMNPNIKDITKFTMNDIWLENYTHEPSIKAEMAV